MTTNSFDIRQGMEVYSSDGQKIGKVDEVYAPASSSMRGSPSSSGPTAGMPNDLAVEQVPSPGTGGYSADTGYTDNTTSGFATDTGASQAQTSSAGTATQTRGGTGYFKVSEGGVLGIGAKNLYVPFSAVDTVATEDGSITLSVTKDEAENRFNTKPDWVDTGNAPDTPIV
ncbi:MAG TPA: hypothetical protein VF221_15485 [Chloroflexota bacterium]